jgi:ribonuclease Z
MVELARGADLLIHEATFSHELQERAEEDGHTTAREAAEVAREAGAKRLALVHISSRYYDPDVLLEEAQQVYENVFVAEDLMEIEIPLPR